MNIMLKIDGEVVTPPLSGTILPGTTRDSVLTILREWCIPNAERSISIDEVIEAAGNGKLEEIFGTGTAAVISPVGELKYQQQVFTLYDGKVGPLSQRLFDHITGIQYGLIPDTYDWLEKVTIN